MGTITRTLRISTGVGMYSTAALTTDGDVIFTNSVGGTSETIYFPHLLSLEPSLPLWLVAAKFEVPAHQVARLQTLAVATVTK